MNKAGLAVNRLFYRTVGRLSNGVSMALDLGLTSGKVLDYIYENKPRGRTFLGKWIDKSYIGHEGWEAVRVRKRNLEARIKDAVAMLRERKQIVIVDIACGYAAYLYSVLAELKDRDIVARGYDIDARWIAAGNDKAERLGMPALSFHHGNLLDPSSAEKALRSADIVISSGFYDWITDDAEILRSLNNIQRSTAPGTLIVLTYQMSHPCLDLVSHVFSDFNGAPLRMKMRSAADMGRLLQQAGVRILNEKTDDFGFYNTVLGRFEGHGHWTL